MSVAVSIPSFDRVQRTIATSFLLGVAALLILSGTAFGQAATTPSRGETTPLGEEVRRAAEGGGDAATTDDGSGGGLVRTIVGLLVVIAVIYGVTWVLKQVKASKEGGNLGSGLETAATLSLGGTRSVHLVRAGSDFLLLGVTDGGVQTLRTYTENEARAAGFPIDDANELRPLTKADAPTGVGQQLVGRIRDMTVRR